MNFISTLFHLPRLRALLLPLLLCASLASAQPRFAFRHVGMESGLSHERVNSVCAGRRGFLWLSTLWGLDCYDGYTVTSFSIPDSILRGGEVLGAQEFGPDTMLLHLSDGYALLKRNTLTYSKADEFLRSRGATDSVSGVWVDGRRNLWMIDHNRVIYSPTPSDSYSFELPTNSKVTNVCPSRFGLAILLSDGRVLRCFPPASGMAPTPQVFTTPLTSGVRTMKVDLDGDLWVISASGDSLWRKPMAGLGWELINNRSYWTDDVPKSLIDVGIDSRNRIWLVSDRNGACVLDPTANTCTPVRRTPNAPLSLRSNLCTCVFTLSSGAVVIGYQHSGFSVYHPSAFKFAPLSVRPPSAQESIADVRCISTDGGGNAYVGTNGDGLFRIDVHSHECEALPFPKQDAVDRVAALSDGSLWTYISNRGFARYGKVRGSSQPVVTYFNGRTDVPDPLGTNTKAGTVASSINGCVWAASGNQVLALPNALRPDDMFKKCRVVSVDDDIVSMRADVDSSSVLVLTRSSIFRLSMSGGDVSVRRLADYDLRPERPSDICVGKHGFIWVAVSSGVDVFKEPDSTGVAHFLRNIAFSQAGVACAADPMGGAVVVTPSEACLIKVYPSATEECGYRFVIGKYSDASGLLSGVNSQRAACMLPFGSVWIGAENGINEYIVENNNVSAVPSVSFSALTSNGVLIMPGDTIGDVVPTERAIPLCSSITIPCNDGTFDVHFSVLGAPSPNCFMYECEVVGSKNPPVVSSDPYFRIPALEPGDYTLRVTAIDPDGRRSEHVTELVIHSYLPWYKSSKLHSILAIILLSIAFGATFLTGNRRGKRKVRRGFEENMLKNDYLATMGEQSVPSTEISSIVLKSVAVNVSTSLDVLADDIVAVSDIHGLPLSDSISIRNMAERLISANTALASVASGAMEADQLPDELRIGRHDIVTVSRTIVRQVAAITRSSKNVGFSTSLRNCVFDFDPEAYRLLLIDVLVDAIVSTAQRGFVRVLVERGKYSADTVTVSVCIGGEVPTSSLYFTSENEEIFLPQNMEDCLKRLNASAFSRDFGDGLLHALIHIPINNL